MKKLYFTLLTALTVSGLNAQTLTAVNHGPQNGSNYGLYQCDSLSVSVGPNGAGVNFAFNSLVTHTNIAFNYTVASGSYTGWPSATLQASSPSPSADISYYSYGASDLKFWGGLLQLGGVQADLKMTSPASFMAYPASLNTGTTSPIAGSVVALSNAGTFTGVCTSTATATGSMTLPGRTFNDIIRVAQTIGITFTIGVFPPGTANRVVYEYYSPSTSRYPILTINQSTISSFAGTSVQQYVYVLKNYQTLGLNAQTAGADMNSVNVFPNPASDKVHFISENINAAKVNVYDVTGKQVDAISMVNGSAELNTSAFNNGLYIYKITDNNNRQIKTGRITVVH